MDGGRGVGWGVPRRERGWAQDRPRSGGQERSSGRQTQEGKTYDSKPNRNQATLIDIRLGGEGRSVPHPPPRLLLLPVFHCMSWESLQEW